MSRESMLELADTAGDELERETGFFGLVRSGGARLRLRARSVRRLLTSLDVTEEDILPRRLVGALWFLPAFLQ